MVADTREREAMNKNRQTRHELETFANFVEAAKLSVMAASVQKRPEPEPDILCSIEGQGDVAFELVQIIDKSMARRDSAAARLRQMLRDTCKNYPEEKRAAFLSRYQDCLFHIAFEEEAPYRDKADAVPTVLDFLLFSDEPITGEIHFGEHRENAEQIYKYATLSYSHDYIHVAFPQNYMRSPLILLKRNSSILRGIKWLNVSRIAHLNGPIFDVDVTGSFGEPALQAIQKKFEKKYSAASPIELLAFYETQPVLPEDLWLDELASFVLKNLGRSPFRAIWIFDAATNQLLYTPAGCTSRV